MEYSDFGSVGPQQVAELLYMLNPDGSPELDMDMFMGISFLGFDGLIAAADARASAEENYLWQMSHLADHGCHMDDYRDVPGFASEVE